MADNKSSSGFSEIILDVDQVDASLADLTSDERSSVIYVPASDGEPGRLVVPAKLVTKIKR